MHIGLGSAGAEEYLADALGPVVGGKTHIEQVRELIHDQGIDAGNLDVFGILLKLGRGGCHNGNPKVRQCVTSEHCRMPMPT
ncbi:MAG: hypothetical protein P1U65_08620 [Minwuia sp.]|nr:hypothetical protein [Minwuia sp.]